MTSPIEQVAALTIGTVEFVSPSKIEVLLETDAPQAIALNTGAPTGFPRINGYVLIPNETGAVVGMIVWLGIERSAFPKRTGMKDFGLIDLPFPSRKLALTPLGTLVRRRDKEADGDCYELRRGVAAFPSVGDPVLLPTIAQLKSIIEAGKEEDRRVLIGTSPLASNARVTVDPNKIFGRHLAVLGNTGSGKSCSVAGLIRWSLEAAQARLQGNNRPNARFIVLDPNGEYSRAFGPEDSDLKARIFRVGPEAGEAPLRVPLWFWNSAEWVAFMQASAKTQKPTLVEALRSVRDKLTEPDESSSHELRRFLRTVVTTIRLEKNSGSPWGPFPKPKAFFEKIEKWKIGLEPELANLRENKHDHLQALVNAIESLCSPRRVQYPHHDFTRLEVAGLLETASKAHSAFGGSDLDIEPSDVDSPRPFTGDALLRSVEATAEILNVSEHVETLLIRLRSLLADTQMKAVIGDGGDLTLEKWLTDYIGADHAESGCLTIIDMSLVPSQIIHMVTAVTARMVLEALQRYRQMNRVTLPTVLVMEEAHTFIKRYKDDIEDHDAATICCQVFERIAREGRKFGLGLVLSSQRPSELSPTVLAQCNTFLLHRIVNDRDQELVGRLVPDNLGGLLKDLPSLPSRQAILLGWATEVPVLVEITELPKKHRPLSADPEFWKVWTGEEERPINWKTIVDDWTGKKAEAQSEKR